MITITLPNGETVEVEADSIEEAEETVLDMIEMGELDTEVPATLGEKVYGAGEAALTALTGATTGLIGGIGGTIGQAAREIGSGEFGSREAAQRIQQASMEGMQAGTRMPKTQEGMETLQAFDELTKPLQALPPIMPQVAATGQLGMQARALGDIAGAAADPAIQKGVMAAQKVSQKVSQKVTDRFKKKPEDDFEGSKSIGAAMTPAADARDNIAQSLKVPVNYTEGEATRDFDLLREEQRLMSLPQGERLRKRISENYKAVEDNFEQMIDDIGAVYSGDAPQAAQQIVDVLSQGLKKAKNQTSTAYKIAELKGALKDKVKMDPLANFMNNNRAERINSGIMDALSEKLKVFEKSQGDYTKGELSVDNLSLGEAEELIQFINRRTDQGDSRDVSMGEQLKSVIDAQTEDAGNKWYKRARSFRVRQAQNYENMSIIPEILATKKGTGERRIAIEHIIDKKILSPSTSKEGLVFLKKALFKGGDEGKQAWNDVEGAILAKFRDDVFSGQNKDSYGQNRASLNQLKNRLKPLIESGKFEVLFRKDNQKNLKLLLEVVEELSTRPDKVVNSSGTSDHLLNAIDFMMTYSGNFLPVANFGNYLKSKITDKKLLQRINKSLREDKDRL